MAYADEVLADSPLRYWRLEESSGSTVTDEVAGDTGTVAGGSDLDVEGAVGSAIALDGVDGRVEMAGVLDGAGLPVTIEAWGSVSDDGHHTGYAESQDVSNSSHVIQAGFGDGFAEGSIRSGTSWDHVLGTTRIDDGQWHHIAVVFEADGGNTAVTVYVDGGEDGSGTIASGFPTQIDQAAIGWLPRSNPVDIMDGRVDEVAIYDHALSAARVLAHYQARDDTNGLQAGAGHVRVAAPAARLTLGHHLDAAAAATAPAGQTASLQLGGRLTAALGGMRPAGLTAGLTPMLAGLQLAAQAGAVRPAGQVATLSGSSDVTPEPAPAGDSGWEALLSIRREAAEMYRADRASPPTACPYDGQPLTPGPVGGQLHCRWGNYLWPRDGRPDLHR